MNKNYALRSWALFLIMVVLFAGCNKEEDETPGNFTELAFDGEAVMDQLPEGLLNSNDEMARECVDMIEQALDMSAFQANLIVPDNAVRSSKKASGDTWYWTWNYMGEIWTFYWTYSEDAAKNYWTMQIQYGNGEKYDYITAWEYKNGSGGEVVYSFNWVMIYEDVEDYEDLHWTYRWNVDASGNYQFEWTYDSDDLEVNYYLKYNIVINEDGSGTLDYYLNDSLFYHIEWDAAGNGSWIYYLGDFTQSGTWDAV
jgi:hypothetical protein